MHQISINELNNCLKGKLFGNNNLHFNYISIDSRSGLNNSETLFFAIKGQNHDAHNYISDLYQSGVRMFVVNYLPTNQKIFKDATFLLVKNTIAALQKYASCYRNSFSIPIVAITGSNGKTIIKDWLSYILEHEFKVHKNPKSYNSQIGVPLSVLLLEKHHQISFFEAGISQPNEMEQLEKILKPKYGIFSNIGDAHQENFKTLEQKIKEKLKLFHHAELIIYCSDYELIHQQIKNHNFQQKTLSWGTKNKADIKIKYKCENNHTFILAFYKDKNYTIKIPFFDKASIENAIHCFVFLIAIEKTNESILERFINLPQIEMRLELKAGINNCTLINDSYNADKTSLRIALDFLQQQKQHKNKCLILSDVSQLDFNENQLYEDIATIIEKYGLQRFIGIGDKIKKHAHKFKGDTTFFDSTTDFIKNIKYLSFNNETILIKGSRNYKLEQISNILQKKTHRTILEINIDNLIHNLNFYRSLLKPDTKIMIMVKAFSYGSGSFEIANILQHQRVDYLGVAFADEGIELRKAGINLPIIVMNPDINNFSTIIHNNLEPELFDYNILKQFVETLKKYGLKKYPVHIKLDTGMHRSGFCESEIDELIHLIANNKVLYIKSVFSHLAASDEPQHDEYTKLQIKKFKLQYRKIQKVVNYSFLKHISNSAAIERFPDAQFNMVRLGIGLYGISTKYQNQVKNISTFKTKIAQIKYLNKGETVGYSRKGILNRNTKIAIVPVGYADGLNRALSNGKGIMFINNKKASIIGNICMDMCMLDITDIECNTNDEVIIFGDNYPVSQLAQKLNTIPYEILTSISERVKRVYFT